MNRLLIISTFILLINITHGQTDRRGIILFDSISQKYAYEKIIEIPEKSAVDLYTIGKKWLVTKNRDDKFLIDENGSKLADLGSFQVSVTIDAGAVNLPMNWVIIYDIITSYKDNKCKVEITSIKLSGNSQGTTNESTLEAYEKTVENGYKGKKKRMQKYLYDLFKEIDVNIKRTLTEFENNIKGTNKTKEW